jgi:MFS family permease
MIVGALLFSPIARWATPRLTLAGAATLVGVGFLMFLPMHSTYTQVIINMVVVGLGSGALVAALPAAAASAAPPTQTGVATGLTNSVKTVGGAIASGVFAIALLQGTTGAAQTGGTAGSFSGYVTVWVVCGVTALVAALLLLLVVPKQAFTDRPNADDIEGAELPQPVVR